MRAMLDVQRARRAFPGLESDGVFFDAAGGSQLLGAALEAITLYARTSFVQLGASYAASRLASERVAAGRAAMAELMGAGAPSELVLGPSTTQLLANLALACAPSLGPGDELIVTELDHESNIGPWRRVAALRGATVRTWTIDRASVESGGPALSLAALDELLSPRTRVVAVTQCSNVLGALVPVAEIAGRVRAAGARLVVDGVAYAPHRLMDVRASGADAYVFSNYKVYGPHVATLWVSPEWAAQLGSINHDFLGEALPYKLEPGGASHELVAALPAVRDYLAGHGEGAEQASVRARLALGFERVAAHEETLSRRLLEFLAQRPGVRVVGPTSADRRVRVPTVSFVVEGRASAQLVAAVDPSGVCVRYGDFYARRLVDALGLRAQGGVVRASMAHYATLGEVDRLIAALDVAIPR
jgi:cysteine desulfurase family protein (TIGR01976 family)